MRQLVQLFAAFTIGALFATVLAERDANEQTNALRQEASDLRVDIEINYQDGYRHGRSERIQEDDPRWDCQTMGNRVCGSKIQAK